MTYTLLTTIISRRYGRIKQESKDSITMFAKPLRQCQRLASQVILFGQNRHPFSDSQHTSVKLVFGNLIALMPEMKQLLKLYQQGLSKIFVFPVGQGSQELNVANQMRQTELLKPVGIFDVGAEKVTYNRSAVCFAQDFFQDFRRTRLGNTEKAEYGCTKDPCPILDTFVFPAGLVNIQNRLGWDVFLEFFIGRCQSIIETFDNIAQMTAGDIHIQDFTKKGLKATIRGMERTFHITDQCLQTRAKQLTFDNPDRQFSPDNSSAFGTDKTVQMVFGDGKRVVIKLYRLLNFWFFNRLAVALIAAITGICVKWDCFINLIGAKRRSIDAFMPELSTLTTLTIGLFGLGRLNNIRGRRLGRVGGILREFGNLISKLSIDFKKFSNLLFKFRNALNVELFFFRSQFLSLRHLLWLLSGERGHPLEENRYHAFDLQP